MYYCLNECCDNVEGCRARLLYCVSRCFNSHVQHAAFYIIYISRGQNAPTENCSRNEKRKALIQYVKLRKKTMQDLQMLQRIKEGPSVNSSLVNSVFYNPKRLFSFWFLIKRLVGLTNYSDSRCTVLRLLTAGRLKLFPFR